MLAARHASTALHGGPWASWWAPPSPPGLGTPKPFSKLLICGFAPTSSPGERGYPTGAFLGLPGISTPFMGLESARRRSGLGKVPAQPLAGESSPGEHPPCSSCAGGVLGRGRELPASYPPASSPRLPPPSPPALLQEEIQQLKSKLEKVEKERNELRLNSDRLESRVGLCRCWDGVRCPASRPQPMVPFPLPPPDHRTDVGADGRAEHRRVGLPAAGR